MGTFAALLIAAALQTPPVSDAPQTPSLAINSPELRIGVEELKELHAKDGVLVIDVRPADAYRGGHIPGSVSIPLDALESRIAELRKERRPIVTYCS
jgi:3-mercaptopyruvate sulfurtransferase SseA